MGRLKAVNASVKVVVWTLRYIVLSSLRRPACFGVRRCNTRYHASIAVRGDSVCPNLWVNILKYILILVPGSRQLRPKSSRSAITEVQQQDGEGEHCAEENAR